MHIYDVSTNLENPVWENSIKVDRNINSIVVDNNYIYLATGPGSSSPYTPLKVYSLGTFSQVSKLNTLSSEAGTSLFLLGKKLYLGLERASVSGSDFYILNITIPLPSSLPVLGYKNLGMHSGKQVSGIAVAGKYGFIGTTDSTPGFEVLDISQPANINTNPPISTFNYSNYNTGIQFENGFVYTSNNQNDSLRIVRPEECSDKIDDDGDNKIDVLDPQCHTDGNVGNNVSYDPEDDSE